MSNYQQNPDGSWSEAQPLPYFPGIDVEQYPTEYRFYDGAKRVGTVKRGRFGLLDRIRVVLKHRRLLKQRYPNGTPKNWGEVL